MADDGALVDRAKDIVRLARAKAAGSPRFREMSADEQAAHLWAADILLQHAEALELGLLALHEDRAQRQREAMSMGEPR